MSYDGGLLPLVGPFLDEVPLGQVAVERAVGIPSPPHAEELPFPVLDPLLEVDELLLAVSRHLVVRELLPGVGFEQGAIAVAEAEDGDVEPRGADEIRLVVGEVARRSRCLQSVTSASQVSPNRRSPGGVGRPIFLR